MNGVSLINYYLQLLWECLAFVLLYILLYILLKKQNLEFIPVFNAICTVYRFDSTDSISHPIKEVNNENQLIYIGPFSRRIDAERYQKSITPRMKDIMKIPANSYNTFIITKASLDKLTTGSMVNDYLEFYSENK